MKLYCTAMAHRLACLLALSLWCLDSMALAGEGSSAQITIRLVAPGDDARIGVAAAYEIRYGLSPITALNWNQASPVPDALPKPNTAGTIENLTVTIPNAFAGTEYYLALRARDEVSNWSPVSNSISFIPGGEVGVTESSVTMLR